MGDRQSVHESAARGVQLERTAPQPESVLHDRGVAPLTIGCGGGHDEGVDLVDAGPRECSSSGTHRHVDRGAVDVSFADAGSLDDPLVAGVEHLLEIVVGEHPLGQIGAPTDDLGPADSGGDARHQLVLSQATGWRGVMRSPSTAM